MAAQPEPAPPTRPVDAPICPLCGEANACAAAASGTFDTPCWCRDASFSAALLERVPEAQRGLACICQRCASVG